MCHHAHMLSSTGSKAPASPPVPPVLDIGGDVVALVATMNDGTAGTELYLRPGHDPATTVHTGVWDRRHAGVALTLAVFPELRAGVYAVLDDHGAAVGDVEIHGGAVATIDLLH